ncbi:hypothetical protein [Nonomuraea rosea]
MDLRFDAGLAEHLLQALAGGCQILAQAQGLGRVTLLAQQCS